MQVGASSLLELSRDQASHAYAYNEGALRKIEIAEVLNRSARGNSRVGMGHLWPHIVQLLPHAE